MYVNFPANQNTTVLDQQYLQGMQNQQLLFSESLGFNQLNAISSGGSSVCKFQQDNECVGSPTLTTNSERSEITEASGGDLCFQRRFQEIQPQLFPQLQQFQQQNFLNPYTSTFQKKGNYSGQSSSPLDEMPLNNSSQGYINWAQRNASPGQQGTLNRTMLLMGLDSQQLDNSLYGRTLANAGGNMSQQPPTQVMYQEPGSLAARRPSGHSQTSLMQLSDFNNSFLKKQYDSSPAPISLQQGGGTSEAGSVHDLKNGMLSGDPLMGNSQSFDASSKNSSGRQEEQASWSSFQQKDTELSQGLVPLDPLEEKILFNMEYSSISEIASGVFGEKSDNVNFSNPFPSTQSGSWSALMQTAVAEASSSDTGLQEEFSSLTYQNMELSTDINDISNFMDSDKQYVGCVKNNTQGSTSLNSGFPGFQLPSDQLRSHIFQGENTPVSTQMSPNLTGQWMDCNSEQKISRGNQQVQSGVCFDNISTGNMYPQSSGMLNQLQAQTCNRPSSTSASHLAGMSSLDPSQGGKWVNGPNHLTKAGTFPHFIQQNDLKFVASQRENATFPAVPLDAGVGGHISSQTRSHQQGTNRQFNVWMDLPTRQHPSDQELLKVPMSPVEISGSDVTTWQKSRHVSSTSSNMLGVGLPLEQGVAAKNISGFTVSNKDVSKLQGETNMDFSTCSKLYEQNELLKMPVGIGMSSMSQLKSFAFDDSKMKQTVYSSGKQPTGNNALASGMEQSHLNLPSSAVPWSKQMGGLRNDQMQLDSEETPDQLTQHSKPLNTVNKNAEIIGLKKRKLMQRKQLAWHEEISNASQRDHTVSGAEQEWAIVSRLLVEKAEYNTQTFEFALPVHRSKRRLVLTTQLVQQLFDPPPSFVLFSAASSSYDTMLFFVARATLGDACSLTHKRENALPSSSQEAEKAPEKIENFERKNVQHSEVSQKLTEKAKKLGESFERLEKTPSMADIICEISDMERFSVINRFARFHSKGPVDNNSGNPSQSYLLKPIPERYIAVRPVPQSFPDGIHCLSL